MLVVESVLENLRSKQKTVVEERDSYKKESDDQKKQIVSLQKKIEKLQADKKKNHRYAVSYDRDSELDKLKKQNQRLQERLKVSPFESIKNFSHDVTLIHIASGIDLSHNLHKHCANFTIRHAVHMKKVV